MEIVVVGLFLALLAPAVALADDGLCRAQTIENTRVTICTIDPASDDLVIVWKGEGGRPYRSFDNLSAALDATQHSLRFAMNGGMYDTDYAPIGLYVEDGVELEPVNTFVSTKRPAPNFYKKPNGIFFIGDEGAGVLETSRYIAERPSARYATQSGPMLLIDGQIHPIFIPGSSDRQRRNGVGVDAKGLVHFVISERAVNFHDFAQIFQQLGCANALYLDGGSAPGLYAPELRRNDWPGHGGFGPIIAVVGK